MSSSSNSSAIFSPAAKFRKIISAATKQLPLFLLLAWTVAVTGSLFLNIHSNHRETLKKARLETLAYLELNMTYREWIADLGGVYAATDKVRPNPYLKVPDRDVSIDGKSFTLVNSAYMVRLVFDRVNRRSPEPIINRITSIKPMNPANIPGEWERKALLSFERGTKEIDEITTVKGIPYLRVMKPLLVADSCLKCHAGQGYKIGDVRGGMAISTPLAPYLAIEAAGDHDIMRTHLLFWIAGAIGLIGFSRTRIKHQQQLVESEWKFRTLAESANDWEYWSDEDYKIKFVTPSCRAVAGYSAEEFTNGTDLVDNIIHPDDRDVWTRHLSDYRAPLHREIEFRIIAKDGGVRWLSHICAPIYFQGEFRGRRASNRDITERKKITEALVGQLRTTDAFFTGTVTPLVFLDTRFNFIRVNEAYARVCHKDVSDFPGLNHFELYPSEELQGEFERVVRTKEPYRIYARPFVFPDHPDRGVTYWDLTVIPILDNSGKVSFLVFSLLDVTERKRLEKVEIEKIQADAASKAKSDFLANMSHELRTPLNSVIGFTELIQDGLAGPLSEQQDEYLGYVANSGRHLLSLINDILDLSKVEAGMMKLDVGYVILDDVLNSAMGMQKEKAMRHGINLVLDASPDMEREIQADGRKLKQILFNLLNNAVKFTPDGGSVRVCVGKTFCWDGEKQQEYLEFSVEDTGIGIKPEDMSKLFKEFTQLESPLDKKYEGTGLGLALTKKMVELHGGKIWAESEPGKGSKFTFIIPCRYVEMGESS